MGRNRGRILQVTRSRTAGFTTYDDETGKPDATTTWALIELPDGDIDEVCMEQMLDLPTPLPLEREGGSVSGDYALFVAAQEGPKAARAYALSHAENAQHHDESERRRQAVYDKIMSRARRRMEQGYREYEAQGNRRLKQVLTGKGAA